jgi:repressor LexA
MARHRVEYPTEIQEQILRIIRASILDRGEAPTVVEIGAAVGLSSRSSVHYQLRELARKNAITVEARRPRGIRLT